jgi:hypothetical protein
MLNPRHEGSRAPKPVTSARRAPKTSILLASERTSPLVFDRSLHVLAYNLKRVIAILGAQPLMEAMRA